MADADEKVDVMQVYWDVLNALEAAAFYAEDTPLKLSERIERLGKCRDSIQRASMRLHELGPFIGAHAECEP